MRTRTLGLLGAALLALALGLGTLSTALAQSAPGPCGQGWGPMQGYGPMMGGPGWGAGPGPQGWQGPMMGQPNGPGGYGPMPWRGPGQPAQVQPLASLEDARQAFQSYLDQLGNADLALEEVMEFERDYYAIVKEKSTGSGAFELLANKQTGAVFPEPGPNMMWNTKYGHMAAYGSGPGMMGGGWAPPTGAPVVTPEQAQQIAQQWLDRYQPGSTTEEPHAFPGYYTLHITRGGEITGMLSVNGYTGQVWYHAWHGAYIASMELE